MRRAILVMVSALKSSGSCVADGGGDWRRESSARSSLYCFLSLNAWGFFRRSWRSKEGRTSL